MSLIWLRDESMTATVEWYLSDKKATGVENIREEWRAVPINRKIDTGFTPKRDSK